jgi:hypothetical protein
MNHHRRRHHPAVFESVADAFSTYVGTAARGYCAARVVLRFV